MHLTLYGPLYPIQGLWALSKNVAGRCGWVNVSFLPIHHWTCRAEPCSGQWNRANEDFFESFRNYDEAGSQQRIQVLKYLVLANMLMGSEVNPSDSQETKP